MTTRRVRVYWDASTWIAYINKETAVIRGGRAAENRFVMCDEILKGAEKSKYEIATSTFTLAEVCKPPEVSSSPLDDLHAFFEKSYILMIPVSMGIGRRAQDLQAAGQVSLKPPDAVHLASAERANAQEFHTFDEGILALEGQLFTSDNKAIKICKPTECLPMPLFDNEERTTT